MKPHIQRAQALWKMVVGPGDTVIDATLGNGHDLFFLAKLLQGEGVLIGYDIQKKALENATLKIDALSEKERSIITLNHCSHKNFLEPYADLIVYNLGYLPGSDKRITTQTETTLESLKSALAITQKALSITCYPGHAEGAREEEALKKWLKTVPKCWEVSCHQWRAGGPSLIWLRDCR